MRLLLICLLLLSTCTAAYADDLFTNFKLQDLRVFDADKSNGTAWVIDKKGNETEIYVGDSIGVEGSEVIAIEDTCIKIKKDNTITTIKVMKASKKAESDAEAINDLTDGRL